MSSQSFQQPQVRFPLLVLSLTLLLALWSPAAQANPLTFNFTGNTVIAIVSGANTIPSGTPFSGTLIYASPQVGATSAFFGGTQTIYQFTSLTLVIGGQTVTQPAGSLVLYNNVTTSPSGVPNGDSLYTFLPGAAIPSSTGAINGITPDFIYLGFVDTTGLAFSGTGLPQTLNLSHFSSSFLGLDYGPGGAGNTDTIHDLATMTGGSGGGTTPVPEPSTLMLFSSSLAWVALRCRKRI